MTALPDVDWPAHRDRVTGVYVHVPFCASDCGYCAFAREVPRERDEAVAGYLDAFAREVDFWRARMQGPIAPRTLYVGGGTPSFLRTDEWIAFADTLARLVSRDRLEEVTVEANPESATADWLRVVTEFGVTRVSLGAQSRDPEILRVLDRRHDWTCVTDAFHRVRTGTDAAISLDLIYGVPGLSAGVWEETVEAALSLAPDHVSAYCLSFEEGTALTRRRRAGTINDQPDDRQRDEYERLVLLCESRGLARYEVSNFGTDRGRSSHNLGYWRGDTYLGLGPSAHSHLAGHRFRNRTRRDEWSGSLIAGEGPVASHERIGSPERRVERLMRLRMVEGVPRDLLPGSEGTFQARVAALVDQGLVQQDDERLRLAPDAFFVSDGVIADLLDAWERMEEEQEIRR